MISMPGLAAAELAALVTDMRLGPYLQTPVVKILDLDHGELDDISDVVIDGQVDATPTGKSLSITVVDPRRSLALDGASPAKGAIFYDKMISVGIRFKGPRLGRWVTIPIFCGPVVSGTRAGSVGTFVCEDKQRLAMQMAWRSIVLRAGTKKVDAIRELMLSTGESPARISLPGLASTLPKDIAIPAVELIWPQVREIAASMDRELLYDGRGVLKMRSRPRDPIAAFRDGEGGNVLTDPEITYDAYGGFNGVQVLGAATAGKRVSYTVWLPAGHPLSPAARKRGGVPFRKALQVKNQKIRSVREAEDVAATYIDKMARETVKATVEVMPNWLLESGDIYTLDTNATGRLDQAADSFSLPIVAGASMMLGANRPIQRPRPRVRRLPDRPTTAFAPFRLNRKR